MTTSQTFPHLSVRELNEHFELLAPGGYAAQMTVLDEVHRRALVENEVRGTLPAGLDRRDIDDAVFKTLFPVTPREGDIIEVPSGKHRVVTGYFPELHTERSHCIEHVTHCAIRDGKPWGATRSLAVKDIVRIVAYA